MKPDPRANFAELNIEDQRSRNPQLDALLKILLDVGRRMAPDISEGSRAESEWERQDSEGPGPRKAPTPPRPIQDFKGRVYNTLDDYIRRQR